MTTDRLQAGRRVYNTLTRVEADITSLLGMKTSTELCCQKCQRTQASRSRSSHNRSSHNQGWEHTTSGEWGGGIDSMGW